MNMRNEELFCKRCREIKNRTEESIIDEGDLYGSIKRSKDVLVEDSIYLMKTLTYCASPKLLNRRTKILLRLLKNLQRGPYRTGLAFDEPTRFFSRFNPVYFYRFVKDNWIHPPQNINIEAYLIKNLVARNMLRFHPILGGQCIVWNCEADIEAFQSILEFET